MRNQVGMPAGTGLLDALHRPPNPRHIRINPTLLRPDDRAGCHHRGADEDAVPVGIWHHLALESRDIRHQLPRRAARGPPQHRNEVPEGVQIGWFASGGLLNLFPSYAGAPQPAERAGQEAGGQEARQEAGDEEEARQEACQQADT